MGLSAVTEREAGFIEGVAYGVDRLILALTGDCFSCKSYDPATVELRRAVIHSYAFNLKDGGRHHPLADYDGVDEIAHLMISEGADWVKQEFTLVEIEDAQ